ncbi:uncharacterized protein MICPUCDRAFT_53623 [Micromonas pusilla CCMP1545]|uniref:Predicted protein n=1 Tax=Micromonas pusilla (strain CCMP1545) TaxID=564608 RepID=C1N7B1_MICPC|nr:uncharacterized protein MICPUCDRAFT_53623 [Micromonas pusilla CCMP1545]EEH52079.1 predicted protein [Micromonas pusilla CCMP1545]|eukprot:XP_003063706.1 predicted protein [Micromonas pusilla CCMP1545]
MADKPFKILYCTGNHGKFAEAKCVIDEYNTLGADVDKLRWVEIQRVDADPVEVQGSQVEIATRKVKEAVKIFHETGRGREVLEGADFLVTEDVGLALQCLNGFPGPYCKSMLERVGPEGLWNLCSRYEDRSCLVTCTLAAIDLRGGRFHWEESIKNARTFVGELVGCISGPPRGSVMHGKASWNSVFTPAGYDQTFGEMSYAKQASFSHRRMAILKFLDAYCPRTEGQCMGGRNYLPGVKRVTGDDAARILADRERQQRSVPF